MKLFEGRPESVKGRQEKEIKVYDLLDSLEIEYLRTDHKAVGTIEDCLEIDKILKVDICKNLFLCNRQKTAYYLLLIPGRKVLKTKDMVEKYLKAVEHDYITVKLSNGNSNR